MEISRLHGGVQEQRAWVSVNDIYPSKESCWYLGTIWIYDLTVSSIYNKKRFTDLGSELWESCQVIIYFENI